MLSTVSVPVQYAGNDLAVNFAFPDLFYTNDQLVVTLTDVNDADTIQTLDIDYTVSGAGVEGSGVVTMVTPPATGEVLTIHRSVAYTQLVDITNQTYLLRSVMETALNLLTMQVQQVKEITDRCVKTTETDVDLVPTLASFQAMITAGIAGFAVAFANSTQIAAPTKNDQLMLWDVDASALHYGTVEQVLNVPLPHGNKGADIASANTLVLGSDGDYFGVTGTTTIKSIGSIGVGKEITLVFFGILTIEHHATDLVLPSGNNIVTKVGDSITFREYAIGDWIAISSNRPMDAKGADIASAAVLPVLAPGYFDVTGTVTVTSFKAVGIGTIIKLHFDAALVLTHHATDLVLPGGANITTAAGDEAEFVEYAAGKVRCTRYQRANIVPLHTLRGAAVRASAFQSLANNTPTIINWNDEIYDTDSIHDTVTNNSRLTVPPGCSKVRLRHQSFFDTNATGIRQVHLIKNGTGALFPGGFDNHGQANSALYTVLVGQTSKLNVVPGDYFELQAVQSSGGALDYRSTTSWFEMEVLE